METSENTMAAALYFVKEEKYVPGKNFGGICSQVATAFSGEKAMEIFRFFFFFTKRYLLFIFFFQKKADNAWVKNYLLKNFILPYVPNQNKVL